MVLGARSADRGSEFIAALVARRLELPLISGAVGLGTDGTGRVIAHKKLERGERESYAARLPAVVSVEPSGEPRYCGPGWVRRLQRPTVEILKLDQLADWNTAPPPLTRCRQIVAPKPRTKVGTKVAGLSLQDKLKLMRGRGAAPAASRSKEAITPEQAARTIKEHLDRWLG